MTVGSAVGEAQRRVRETMAAAGGYWRPLAAVARLLEELGELVELPAAPGGDPAGELADLWIITTALADQFLAEVREPGEGALGEGTAEALLAAAGPIARVVNHYDGPKVPRAGMPMPTLHGAVQDFQGVLASLAQARDVELSAAVGAKIEQIHRRGDIERFGQDSFDPSSAAVLTRLAAGGIAPLLPERLWGAPDLGVRADVAARVAAARPTLEMFAKAAVAERLEGFVIAGPQLPVAAAGDAAWLGALSGAIASDAGGGRLSVAGQTLHVATLRAPGQQRLFALLRAAG
jgi:hypothetical protein